MGKGLLILLAIAFFPITITVFIFKSNMSTKAKLISAAALWGVVLIVGALSPSNNNTPTTDNSSIVSEVQEETPNKELHTASETTSTSETITSTETSEVETEDTTEGTETTVVTTTTEVTTTEPVVKLDTELGINYPRPTGSPELTVGSSGDEVCWLQEALNKTLGYGMAVDGSFGNGTAAKVTEFQKRCDLTANGVADAVTIKMLVDILSGNKKLPDPPVVVTDPPVTQPPVETQAPVQNNSSSYVVNTNTGKFHYPSCSRVGDIKAENRWDYTGSRDDLIAQGYVPCKRCDP